MAVAILTVTGYVWGIPSAETGVNIETFTVEVEPEINEWIPGIDGQARGKVVGDPQKKLTMEGETAGSTGVMAATFVTAFAPVNSTTYWGASAGIFLMDRGSVTNNRGSLKKFNAEFTSKTNVTAV